MGLVGLYYLGNWSYSSQRRGCGIEIDFVLFLGLWVWGFIIFLCLFLIFNILYHLKTAFSWSHHISVSWKAKREFPYSSFGIGGIFFSSFSSLLPPSPSLSAYSLYREKVKNESQRGHRKAWTPYHESKKKTTDLTGQHTHIHTPHAHT